LKKDKELEQAKVDLSLRADFNLYDGYRLLDAEERGFVNSREL